MHRKIHQKAICRAKYILKKVKHRQNISPAKSSSPPLDWFSFQPSSHPFTFPAVEGGHFRHHPAIQWTEEGKWGQQLMGTMIHGKWWFRNDDDGNGEDKFNGNWGNGELAQRECQKAKAQPYKKMQSHLNVSKLDNIGGYFKKFGSSASWPLVFQLFAEGPFRPSNKLRNDKICT
jgi:hypothetical protein